MAQRKIKSATDQRKFTIVYNDFLENEILDKHEKLIYIAIKRFADNDTLKAFPSLKTLHKITGISIKWIKKSIEHMEQLGVISVEHRDDDEKGHQSNLYTLYDYAEIWKVGSSNDVVTVAEQVSEIKLVTELRARGYRVEKELSSDRAKGQMKAQNPNLNILDVNNDIHDIEKSQVAERYTLDDIREIYDYDILKNDYPLKIENINSVIEILHNVLNCTQKTIRIGKEEKPAMVVISKMMKLTYSEIIYAIDKFNAVTERINNPISYMLTILFNIKEQMNLDISNRIQNDQIKNTRIE